MDKKRIERFKKQLLERRQELLFQQTTHARGLLGGIDAALARIADGTFGQCMVCEEEIGAKRLEALPWPRYCISCQESSEKNR